MITEVFLSVTNLDGDTFVLDLYDAERIALTWRFTELNSLGTTGSFSKQFRVPNTANNQLVFGTIFNVNSSGDKISFSRKAPAELKVSTVPITYGHIQLKQVINRVDLIQDYEISFFAETPDLTRSLGSLKLSDIDYTELVHEIDFENVTTGDTNWIYALTDRGQKWSQGGEGGSRPILNTSLPVYPNELTPCLNGLWLWQKIMSDAGFTYSGTSLDSYLADYWLPCANEQTNQTEVQPQQYLFNVKLSANESAYESTIVGDPLPSPAELFDNNNDVVSGVWTAPYTGEFRFKAWVTFNPDGTGVNGQFRFGVRRVGTTSDILWASSVIQVGSTQELNFQSIEFGQGIIIGEGQDFEMFIGFSNGLSVELIQTADNDPNYSTGWAMVGTGLQVAGQDISWETNVPEMTQIDFVKSIISMHNLVCIPDRAILNKLIFVPFSEYIASGTARNWTTKLDLQKDIVLTPTTDIQKRDVRFSHKAGSDIGSTLYTGQNRIYGDYYEQGYNVIDGEPPNDFATGELQVITSFQSIPSIDVNGTSTPIQKFVNAEGNFQKPLPCLLYNAGTADIAIYNDATFAGEIATINILSHYDTLFPDSPADNDLNFAPEVPLYNIPTPPFDNLFNRFYQSYMGEIYSDEARIMEAYFTLTLTDVLNFKFSDSIFVKEAYWRILEIVDYEVGTKGSTKVILIKRVNIPLDCLVVPVSVSIGGVVSFEDASGDPAAATKSCCRRYGYWWQATSSTCVSIPPSPVNRQQRNILNGFSNGQDTVTDRSFIAVEGSQISRDSNQAVITGSNISVEGGNYQSLIVGDTIYIEGDQRGMTAVGKNIAANIPGFHLGGGWYEDERETAIGQQQVGMIVMSGAGDWDASLDELSMTIEGIKNKHISLIDDIMWTAELTLSVVKEGTGVISSAGHAVFVFNMYKSGGTASASAVTTVASSNTHGTYSLTVDTTTNTTQHRMLIRSTGGTYPYEGMRLVACIKYTQIRIES